MDLMLNGKTAMITGSGRGIGRTIAMTLAKEGVRVAINDYYLQRAEKVVREIQALGGEATPIQADVTQIDQVIQMVKKITDTWGKLDILVNNAGIPAGILEDDPWSIMKRFMDTSKDYWEQLIQLDFLGTLNCCHTVFKHMADREYGKVINIISDAGRVGEPRQAVYSGVKAGIVGFSKAAAKEMARYRVNVNCVSPAAVTGTYLAEAHGTDNPQTDEEQKLLEKIKRIHPLGRSLNRLGLPSDVAQAVCFFASDVAEWITGQVLSVNGGYCMVG